MSVNRKPDAFLVSTEGIEVSKEGIEQAELIEPWKAVQKGGRSPRTGVAGREGEGGGDLRRSLNPTGPAAHVYRIGSG
jgi:hypothetical protein